MGVVDNPTAELPSFSPLLLLSPTCNKAVGKTYKPLVTASLCLIDEIGPTGIESRVM